MVCGWPRVRDKGFVIFTAVRGHVTGVHVYCVLVKNNARDHLGDLGVDGRIMQQKY